MPAPSNVQPVASPVRSPFLIVVVGWILPGSAFFFLGPRMRGRALVSLIVIHLTFLFGVLLKGGLVWPAWSLYTPGFSILNNLTVVVQMGAGWLAALSLGAHLSHWGALAAVAAVESHSWFELGSFYCLVAGALNYFAVCQALDRNHKKPFEILAKQ
ncbi:hypothetical protein JW916_00895 [Candidatus Sumerlaeota bacterium]|nr:hypothetical protein [Candidatus Sumerlaeota bacterium]